MGAAEFQAWAVRQHGRRRHGESGQKLFEQPGCQSCHQGSRDRRARPPLAGCSTSRSSFADGRAVVADDATRESILTCKPGRAGHQPTAPTSGGPGERGRAAPAHDPHQVALQQPVQVVPAGTRPSRERRTPSFRCTKGRADAAPRRSRVTSRKEGRPRGAAGDAPERGWTDDGESRKVTGTPSAPGLKLIPTRDLTACDRGSLTKRTASGSEPVPRVDHDLLPLGASRRR